MKRLFILLVVSTVVLISSCSVEKRFAKLVDKNPELLKNIKVDINDTIKSADISLELEESSFTLNKDSIKRDSLIEISNKLSFERDSLIASLFQIKSLDSVQINDLRSKLLEVNSNHDNSIVNIITTASEDNYQDTCFLDKNEINILIDSVNQSLIFYQQLCLEDGKILKVPIDTLYKIDYQYKDVDVTIDASKKIGFFNWIKDVKTIFLLVLIGLLILLLWRIFKR